MAWSSEEDTLLCAIVHEFGVLAGGGVTNWFLVADVLCGSSAMQGIHRAHSECLARFRSLAVRWRAVLRVVARLRPRVGRRSGSSVFSPARSVPSCCRKSRALCCTRL